MVKVRYKARLGNNLFQYCLGRILANELGFVLQADPIPGFPNTAQQANEAVYGRNTTPRQIFEGRVDAPSSPVVDFRDRLEENTVPQD